ncbi:MAG: hypothetical protein H6942_11955 [Candidatus Accumulibacter sp.]|uniref:hypothetical protein n=1 Tax=Accumulibacter sp. TaxID=2053492 RepID=UPI0019E0B20D|nr:hypothetical protein [Accumulibacter sp.]MBE2260423.1 hypothetical protein [Paracoccaceae bacterium]MCB1941953.1 hypothetical protein [Accumulibacter sp.]MCP5249227.1 hypothetical protein [Accumulibacter sp.]
MKPAAIALALLFAPPLAASAAETLSCPLLTSAVQVGNCPSEAELKYTFNGYCSDNRRMYEEDASVCTDYQDYRKLKNVAHWESADGAFTAYLSCDLPARQIKAAHASRITIAKRGKITLLACDYGEGIIFNHRSRQQCSVVGDGNCAASPASCQASCE